MKEEEKRVEEPWERELKSNPLTADISTEFVESKEEQREIEDALRANRERRKLLQPKKVWVWKTNGIFKLKYTLYILEFIALCLTIFFLAPLAFNIPFTFKWIINTICTATLLTAWRWWWKNWN